MLICYLKNIWSKMMFEYVQIQIVKCQLLELMVVLGLLAVDATKVCVLNVQLTK
jgi:hypothetical protein